MYMNALLLSASKEGNTEYLEHALPIISEFLADRTIVNAVFIPFAGVTISYGEYTTKVKQALASLPFSIKGIHEFNDYQQALKDADVIIVGGGNTFELLNQLYNHDLLDVIQQSVERHTYYIGWSAGSNIAGQSIKTTNDMPIVQPQSFTALNLVPFQLNPHYTDFQPPGHNGETRQMRIEEFMVLNPLATIVGIQEGSALQLNGHSLSLKGNKDAFIFKSGDKTIVQPQQDLSELLK
ncbi:dipeptidase PepE [Psychrosphaera sp. B3R10]|uniref:dipeptidase PepE n=2 Tax=Psychrosphaera TaxID=907197 RepID=UPI00352C8ED1